MCIQTKQRITIPIFIASHTGSQNSIILGIDFSLKKLVPVILLEFKYFGTKFVDENLSFQVSYHTTYSCSNASVSCISIWLKWNWKMVILVAIFLLFLFYQNRTQDSFHRPDTEHHICYLVNTKRYYCMILVIIKDMYMA